MTCLGSLGEPRGSIFCRLEQLHHEKRAAVLAYVIVQNRHGASVLDRARDVAFAQKALPDVRVDRQLEVEDLDRTARAVPMRRAVHRGHATDPEQTLEPPLLLEHRPDTRLGAGCDGVHRFAHREAGYAGREGSGQCPVARCPQVGAAPPGPSAEQVVEQVR